MVQLEMISPEQLEQYRYRSDTVIIDLRSETEFRKYHIPGARHIAFEDVRALFGLSRSKVIILYCERGASSLIRAKEMAAKGYRVKSLTGGIRAYRDGKKLQ